MACDDKTANEITEYRGLPPLDRKVFVVLVFYA
ncbi:hypothetical protein T01_788 [Trichinella spiralis]|uniref:Uncharacterized protein n=1 Tax=Trichinella spiralis TaxID=6334 RepID=A0A0V1AKL0_TRISP|nr:hypothetical protein T01_788 [Trichinella spiralis]